MWIELTDSQRFAAMGLSSVLSTALTGMSAATTAIQVIGNNLANANTDGFKQSKVSLTTQTPSTRGAGSSDTNPLQIGRGVQVAQVTTDFSQGSMVASSSPFAVSLQGAGLFVLEGPSGERLFSRDGSFHVNADRELVNASGDRVLGFGVDENFDIQDTELVPITLPSNRTVLGENGEPTVPTSFSIDSNGTLRGRYSDGSQRSLGQLQVATFANPGGLLRSGGNQYAAGPNSGLPVLDSPGTRASGSLVSGTVELSNVDVGRNLVDLMLARTQFSANQIVLSTGAELFEEVTRIKR